MDTPTILVVDDDEVFQEVMVVIIEALNGHALVAECALDAMKILETHTPDLVVSDIFLPQINGFDFFCKIRELQSQMAHRFIFITGGSQPHLERKIEEEGLSLFYKSCSLTSIMQIMENELDKIRFNIDADDLHDIDSYPPRPLKTYLESIHK